jgi:hypothetical protein
MKKPACGTGCGSTKEKPRDGLVPAKCLRLRTEIADIAALKAIRET